MTTKERLKEFVEKLGYGQNAFEKHIGIANGYLASKSKSVTSDTVEKILNEFPDINLDWLFTGEGEMVKKSKQKNDVQNNNGIVGIQGDGNNIHNYSDLMSLHKDYQELLKSKDGQIDKLIEIINAMKNGK